MLDVLNMGVYSQYAVPVELVAGAQTTITVASGDTVFYGQSGQVSSTNNSGSLTAGQSLVISGLTWLVSASTSTVKVATGPAPLSWQPIVLGANVGIYSGFAGLPAVARAMVDPSGIAHLDGVIVANATVAAGATIMTLPANCLPVATKIAFPWNNVVVLEIPATGVCIGNAAWTIGNVIVLDGVTFPIN